MELVGWIGSSLLMFCGLPMAVDALKTKKDNTNLMFLLMWYFGEILSFIYALPKSDIVPIICNYGINIILISVILYFNLKGKRNE